ncbi:hypothetical protein EJ02DRAFT_246995 [Clathrospora elynae]|uniref:Uncharacterized protein n=1 Tax=Clathrospora elynae TaxID=706981 RepID=A0A6A5SK12_9PLEO|nr:hypothetical protein EJ02DRAFT_246995 [Clathrospora elynae]
MAVWLVSFNNGHGSQSDQPYPAHVRSSLMCTDVHPWAIRRDRHVPDVVCLGIVQDRGARLADPGSTVCELSARVCIDRGTPHGREHEPPCHSCTSLEGAFSAPTGSATVWGTEAAPYHRVSMTSMWTSTSQSGTTTDHGHGLSRDRSALYARCTADNDKMMR